VSHCLARDGSKGQEAINECLLCTILRVVGAVEEACAEGGKSVCVCLRTSGQCLDCGLLGCLRCCKQFELSLCETAIISDALRHLELESHGIGELLESRYTSCKVGRVVGGLESEDAGLLTHTNDDTCGESGSEGLITLITRTGAGSTRCGAGGSSVGCSRGCVSCGVDTRCDARS